MSDYREEKRTDYRMSDYLEDRKRLEERRIYEDRQLQEIRIMSDGRQSSPFEFMALVAIAGFAAFLGVKVFAPPADRSRPVNPRALTDTRAEEAADARRREAYWRRRMEDSQAARASFTVSEEEPFSVPMPRLRVSEEEPIWVPRAWPRVSEEAAAIPAPRAWPRVSEEAAAIPAPRARPRVSEEAAVIPAPRARPRVSGEAAFLSTGASSIYRMAGSGFSRLFRTVASSSSSLSSAVASSSSSLSAAAGRYLSSLPAAREPARITDGERERDQTGERTREERETLTEERETEPTQETTTTSTDEGEEAVEEETCSICWDTMASTGNGVSEIDPCKHAFHFACISVWAASHNTCPVCRGNVGRINFR